MSIIEPVGNRVWKTTIPKGKNEPIKILLRYGYSYGHWNFYDVTESLAKRLSSD